MVGEYVGKKVFDLMGDSIVSDAAVPNAALPSTPQGLPIVVSAPDLFFATRFEDVIRQQGGRPVLVETPKALVDAVDATDPVLVLVDLNAPGDWEAAIQRLKMRPHTRQIPIYAFGSHVDTATLTMARRAGADHAWARSKLMEALPTLVAQHLSPPVRYPEGWDEAMSEPARIGVEEFNAGAYFEQHEHFETAWKAETRPIRDFYQGVLQVGVAFYHIQHDNWAGALKLFRRGLTRLRDLPPVCRGIDLAALRTVAEEIHAEVTELGPARLAEFDQRRFPKIRWVGEGEGKGEDKMEK
jgi:predicted metal-dependent hydrolase